MNRRILCSVYIICALSVLPMFVLSFWYEKLIVPTLYCFGFVTLPFVMSFIELILRGNSDFNIWIWSGKEPWPKQDGWKK